MSHWQRASGSLEAAAPPVIGAKTPWQSVLACGTVNAFVAAPPDVAAGTIATAASAESTSSVRNLVIQIPCPATNRHVCDESAAWSM